MGHPSHLRGIRKIAKDVKRHKYKKEASKIEIVCFNGFENLLVVAQVAGFLESGTSSLAF